MLTRFKIIKKRAELQKDFTNQEFSNPIMEFWEFFENNTQYTLLRYEHIIDGITAIYCKNSSHPKGFTTYSNNFVELE